MEVDDSEAVDVVLKPGQISLHHGRTFHASHANQTSDRRIGVAIRYIPPSMAQANGTRTMATLVSGEDRNNHFVLAPAPAGFALPKDRARTSEAELLKESILYATANKAGRRHHAA